MKKSDISFLKQLIDSLEESEKKLEDAYNKKDSEEFDRVKKFILKIQKQIEGILG